jgi:hypothetical protein
MTRAVCFVVVAVCAIVSTLDGTLATQAAVQSTVPRAIDATQRVYELAQAGRYRDAQNVIDATSATPSSPAFEHQLRVRLLLERRAWEDVLKAVHGTSGHLAAYAAGLAAARTSTPDPDSRSMRLARAMLSALEREADSSGRRSIAEVERLSVQAAIAAAQEEREELALLLGHALDLERALAEGPIPVLPIPVDELAGDRWLDVDRDRDALRAYLASLVRYPARARSLLGLARASAASGDAVMAREAYRSLLAFWARADADRPELAEAATFLGFLRP